MRFIAEGVEAGISEEQEEKSMSTIKEVSDRELLKELKERGYEVTVTKYYLFNAAREKIDTEYTNLFTYKQFVYQIADKFTNNIGNANGRRSTEVPLGKEDKYRMVLFTILKTINELARDIGDESNK